MEVRVENLSMIYQDAETPVKVIEDLSFQVNSGDSIAILGESGVGKTTLLYLLGALEEPTDGDILVGNESYRQLRSSGEDLANFRGRNVGIVFQFHQLLAEFDAVENVAMPLRIQGVEREVAEQRARELLERVGLGDRLRHRPGILSGGEQQRVAVARALAPSPGLILADEPTGNLDQRNGQQVTELLKQFQQEDGVTLITVTHSLELARTMDRVVELTSEGLLERS